MHYLKFFTTNSLNDDQLRKELDIIPITIYNTSNKKIEDFVKEYLE